MLKNDSYVRFRAPPLGINFVHDEIIELLFNSFRVNNCVKNNNDAEEPLECTGKIGLKKC